MQLDGLRGIAAVSVMLFHYSIYESEFHAFPWPRLFRFGFYGMELFFVISGFAIYYTIQHNTAVQFLVNRFIRLFPTYWLCLATTYATITLFPLDDHRHISPFEALVNLTMLNGVVSVKSVDPSYWSLRVELFFYFAMTALLLLGRLKRIDTILWGWLVLAIGYAMHPVSPFGMLLNLQYGPLFVGGICFYRMKFGQARSLGNYALLAASYGSALVTIGGEQCLLFMTLIYLLVAVGLFTEGTLLSSKLLTYLGTISYSLYLVHQNIGYVILHEFQKRGLTSPWLAAVPIATSIALASIVTFQFERPVMKWLKRAYARTPVPVPSATS